MLVAMPLDELETRRVEKAVAAFMARRRPPPHVRPELDLVHRIRGQSLELYEVRPAWRRPGETVEQGVAKATYVRSRDVWKVYWPRADLKWHRYDPAPEVESVEEFLTLVDEDRHACFFG